MKHRILSFICLLSLVTALFVPSVFATTPCYPEKVVFDSADLMDAGEEQSLQTVLHQAWESADCGFYFATYELSDVLNAGGREYLGELFLSQLGFSENTDLVILTVYRNGLSYYYDFFTFGDAEDRISQKEVDYLLDLDAVYDNIKGGRLAEGAGALFELAPQAYEGRVGVSYLIIGTVALGIALVIGLVSCVCVYASYKKKNKSVDYPLDRFAKLELTAQNDVFVGSFVTKRVIQSGNGGGRSGGGGGGGGHRGGR